MRKEHKFRDASGAFVRVIKTAPKTYKPDWNGWKDAEHEMGMRAADESVTDKDSKAYHCFEISQAVKIGEVVLRDDQFKAPNLVRLKEAISQVTFVPWDPWDI